MCSTSRLTSKDQEDSSEKLCLGNKTPNISKILNNSANPKEIIYKGMT